MKRQNKIIHNRIRCKNCGEIIESHTRHDFVECKCFKESNGLKGVACDGGTAYLRRLGNPDDYEELSESRPFTDEEVKAYNEQQMLLAEQFGELFRIELME